MNFEGLGENVLQRIFGKIPVVRVNKNDGLLHTVNLNGKKTLICDQWHFSATKVSEKEEIYDRTYDAWKRFQKTLKKK